MEREREERERRRVRVGAKAILCNASWSEGGRERREEERRERDWGAGGVRRHALACNVAPSSVETSHPPATCRTADTRVPAINEERQRERIMCE